MTGVAVLLGMLLVVAVGAAWYWRGVATAAGTAVDAVAERITASTDSPRP